MIYRIIQWNGSYQIDIRTPNGHWFVGQPEFTSRLNAEITACDFFGMTEWVKPTPVLAEIPGYIES